MRLRPLQIAGIAAAVVVAGAIVVSEAADLARSVTARSAAAPVVPPSPKAAPKAVPVAAAKPALASSSR